MVSLMNPVREGSTIAGWRFTVSYGTDLSRYTEDIHGLRLHTVFHSILSTRIAIHTAEVLKQDIVGSQPTLTRYEAWTGIEFAHVSETSTEVAADGDAATA